MNSDKAGSSVPFSSHLHRLFAENRQDVIYVYRFSPQKGLEYINPAIETLSGYSVDEWLSKSDLCLRTMHPEDLKVIFSCWNNKTDIFGPLVVRVLHRNGQVIWTDHRGVIERDSGGKLIWVAGIARDVTTQEKIADERVDLLVKERAARIQAEAAIRMRSEFFEALVHDLRTPLTTIILRSEWILKRMTLSDLEWARKIVPSIEAVRFAAVRMRDLIEDLVELIKLSTTKSYLEEERKWCDAPLLVKQSVEELLPIAEKKGIQIEMNIEEPGIRVKVSERRIYRSLENLLGNAIKFSRAHSLVRVALRREGPYALFSIGDSGPGISERDRPYIFDRFWKSPSGCSEGLGLGLAIVKGIVESHGGMVWVENQPGNTGSTFYFKLPCEQANSNWNPIHSGKVA